VPWVTVSIIVVWLRVLLITLLIRRSRGIRLGSDVPFVGSDITEYTREESVDGDPVHIVAPLVFYRHLRLFPWVESADSKSARV